MVFDEAIDSEIPAKFAITSIIHLKSVFYTGVITFVYVVFGLVQFLSHNNGF